MCHLLALDIHGATREAGGLQGFTPLDERQADRYCAQPRNPAGESGTSDRLLPLYRVHFAGETSQRAVEQLRDDTLS